MSGCVVGRWTYSVYTVCTERDTDRQTDRQTETETERERAAVRAYSVCTMFRDCLLYTSDAADDC